MYVVMPVPASVRAAITPGSCTAADAVPYIGRSSWVKEPTPRLANGKPDLTGTGRRRDELALRLSPLRSFPDRRL